MIDIDSMVWSYSRLNSFHTCKYSWYLKYVKKTKEIQNAFAQFGILCHGLIDDWAKGKLTKSELLQEYEKRYYKTVTLKFPKGNNCSMDSLYYKRGYDYFSDFNGFGQKEIILSEKTYKFDYEGLKYKAIIDLVVRDDDNKLIVIDHKSWGQSWTNAKIETETKQLYFYSIAIWKKFKELPSSLNFNLFARGDWYREEFDKKKGAAVRNWIAETIKEISNEEEFKPKQDEYFCNNICGYRHICPYKKT